MQRRMWMRWMGAVAGLALAACQGDAEREAAPVRTEPAVGAATATAAGAPVRAAGADALSVAAERRGPREYALSGTTGADSLQLSVEDGHNVLFGPTDVAVADGRFRAEVALEETDRPTVFAYFADAAGTRQWVVPIPLDQPRVEWSGAAEAAP